MEKNVDGETVGVMFKVQPKGFSKPGAGITESY